ncbi:MAG: NADH-quinone oxidoreductase subunit N [Phycisphaerales bacterium]|nr:NADH-quinone oxidoreductase subunit N [Phycisphaerales bacterium]
MVDRLFLLTPEFILLFGAIVCVIAGLSNLAVIRRRVGFIACGFLLASAVSVPFVYNSSAVETSDALFPHLGAYVKFFTAIISIILVMAAGGLIDRNYEHAVAKGKDRFHALRSSGGEFHGLLLLSVTGLMLVCEARDLIWLFLALELVSLPTYVMVAMSRWSRIAQEAAMKYFFLGAMSAGLMLYGFALIYVSTGSLVLQEISATFQAQMAVGGGLTFFAIIGVLLSLFGLCYKIAAAPLHLYAPDVYQGTAAPVTAFLAFIPKTAGMLAIILLLSMIGWERGLPPVIEMSLWVIAVLTMILGNIGALLQQSTQRMLGYSSIAHSGYMLMGVIAGPPLGLTAVFIYLVIYGLTNTGAFATIASLTKEGHRVDRLEDIAGLYKHNPLAASSLAISSGSLLGIPPLFGFWGKLLLFIAAISAGQILLVVIAALTSAVSAWYYLKIIGLAILSPLTEQSQRVTVALKWPLIAAILSAIIAIGGPFALSSMIVDANQAMMLPE